MHCLVLKLMKEWGVFSAEPSDEAFFGSLKYWNGGRKVKNTAFQGSKVLLVDHVTHMAMNVCVHMTKHRFLQGTVL